MHRGIDQLDIGPARAAFLWRMTGGNVYGTGLIWELRAVSLKGGVSTLLDTGLISGACGFGLPSAASARANPIAYLDAGSKCDKTETRFATVHPVSGLRGAAATPGGLAAGAAYDGDTLYWLRVAGQTTDVPVPGAGSCSVAAARWRARRLAATRVRRPAPARGVALGLRSRPLRPRLPLGARAVRHAPAAPARDRAMRCADAMRITYVVTKGSRSVRTSFSVARAPDPDG